MNTSSLPIKQRSHVTCGFTIVELLIVIVVIGILAAIAIVSYNGVQQRAHIARFQSLISAWDKVIVTYRELGPVASFNTCLGSVEDFPAGGGFQAGNCGSANVVPAEVERLLSTSNAKMPPGIGRWPTNDQLHSRGVYVWGTSGGNHTLSMSYIFKGTECFRSTDTMHVYADVRWCVRNYSNF